MKEKNQMGFSIVEMILVVTIVGIIATLAIPLLSKGIMSAENGSTNATLKIMLNAQTTHFVQKNRYARLSEINTLQEGHLGTMTGDKLMRGKFEYEMVPATPTDEELKATFRIKATRVIGNATLPYVMEITPGGYTSQIFP